MVSSRPLHKSATNRSSLAEIDLEMLSDPFTESTNEKLFIGRVPLGS